MSDQLTIDDLEKHTDRAVSLAGSFADPEWYKEAVAVTNLLCRLGRDFTTDDVWEMLDRTGLKTPEPRALGAIVRKLAREGKIYTTGQYRKSTRKECHRRPLAVWRPVLYRRNTREAE